eukprot:TRINITY_DN149_c0_g1_i2.p1 TRINITY_DN149_c0_g1~~TRINITY_DN149_c0_g1_i2.p1  ORF type:complete len:431 (-),score=116.87 TRINITY_DN149_c0_g1_i2:55-1347(-)
MTSTARSAVSKKKRRYKKHGFDLDLTYVTRRIIAMGFPSVGKEALYRNPLKDVVRFFEKRHSDHYRLYNLCAERHYEVEKFHGRVGQYPFFDHNAPPIDTILECCNDIHDWLEADPKNIVGINCKAGKGRTGLIICCYLLHCRRFETTEEALEYYGHKRTKNGKGVTIASQQRYIRYYQRVMFDMGGIIPNPPMVLLSKIRVTKFPVAGKAFISIEYENDVIHETEPNVAVDKKAPYVDIPVLFPVQGDIKIQLAVKKGGRNNLCHFWFNTAFVEDFQLFMEKSEIDVANKDPKCKIFKEEFSITCFFTDDEITPKSGRKKKKGGKKKKHKNKNKKQKKAQEVVVSEEEVEESVSSEKEEKPKKGNARKSFYDYSDYGALQEQLSLSDEEDTSELAANGTIQGNSGEESSESTQYSNESSVYSSSSEESS